MMIKLGDGITLQLPHGKNDGWKRLNDWHISNSSVYIWFWFLSISNFSVEAVLLSCLSIKTLILSTQFFCVNGCYAYFANHQRFKLLFYLIPPLCKLAIKKSFKSLRHESKLRMKCGIEETIWPRIAVISAY